MSNVCVKSANGSGENAFKIVEDNGRTTHVNLNKVLSMDRDGKFLHMQFKHSGDNVVTYFTDQDVEEAYTNRAGSVIIEIYDKETNGSVLLDLSTVIRINKGNDKRGNEKLYITDCSGASRGFQLSEEDCKKVEEAFNLI